LITVEIAGYTYDTENFCPYCIEPRIKALLIDVGDATIWGDSCDAEQLLDRLAGLLGEDRSYWDSNDYPVPFSGQQAHTDASHAALDEDHEPCCSQCGESFTD
jgi:hypothetical protein